MNTQPSIHPTCKGSTILTPGSGIELVYSRTVALMKEPHTPELPETGNGVSWTYDIERVLAPIMPLASDRNATRVHHYLVQLRMKGLLDIDEGDGMISLPTGDAA